MGINQSDLERVERFLKRWQGSSGNERANYQLFFAELCDALGVERGLIRWLHPEYQAAKKVPVQQVIEGVTRWYFAELQKAS